MVSTDSKTLKKVTKMFQKCFEKVSKKLQILKKVSKILQKSFKKGGVTHKNAGTDDVVGGCFWCYFFSGFFLL